MILIKKGLPIIIEVYVDGRAGVFMPQPPGFREKLLGRLFLKSLRENGGTENLEPGRYYFNYTKISLFRIEAELELIED